MFLHQQAYRPFYMALIEVSKDLCTLVLKTQASESNNIAIHNVYNPTRNEEDRQSILPRLKAELAKHQGEQVIVGDFNLHHEC